MELTQAIRTRRSRHLLTAPAPSDTQFTDLVRTAASAPDHGTLRPWRWLLLRGTARHVLGDALAAQATDGNGHRLRDKPLRAPLLASIIFCPHEEATRVPAWEQLAATTLLVHSVELLLHDAGWGSIWRTGGAVEAPAVREALHIGADERLLGWLYVGTPDGRSSPPARTLPSVRERVTSLSGRHPRRQGGAAPGRR
ncbi:nitroreductase family protein [Streptomyces sp. TRM 70351]|uniref:nitroreductase family protein n=1 Tax=Streptomyces sp. TRM 70351 TaxID=3116552 RepID=UPI002E7B7A2B|nr:nitroreductase family protein [Streptomyces sp. TRM 70351]MEE1930434.1 nitroreductase family protein [Streptomyces sp. TRM 70351]